MTAQAMEKIFINGGKRYMASEPLAAYLATLKERPKFFFPDTGCWRGYYGTWEIKENKLYLIDLECYTADLEKRVMSKHGMDFLFPMQKRVFAEWFTGELRIPEGDMLNYVHMGYESKYEIDSFISIEKGIVTGKRHVDNLVEMAKEIINEEKEIKPDNNGEINHPQKSFIRRIFGRYKAKRM